ncbi:MAG: LytTR family transcriptional regulator DNA-binding domain-containing protein [Bacteroidia bacterium]
MLKFLAQPYPQFGSRKEKIRTAVVISIFVALFLLIFQPFDLSQFEFKNKTWFILGYGLVTLVVFLAIEFTLPFLFRIFFAEENWTTGKQIFIVLLTVFCIGLGNYFYTGLITHQDFSINKILFFQVVTLAVAVFPVLILTLWNQVRLLRKNQRAAEQINKVIAAPVATYLSSHIHLIAENEKDAVDVDGNSLLLIEASDNYSTVYYTEQGNVKNHLIRSSLKRIESQINHPDIIRCHRTYIVNLLHVKSVSGNAQGYRLRLDHFDQSIPVSRNLNGEIKNKLSRHNK